MPKVRQPVASKPDPPTRAGPGRPRRRDTAAAAADDGALGRQSILKAALALIDDKGLADFNIRDLAAALEVSPAAIYWHVPNRSALVSGAIALALDGVADSMAKGTWQVRLRSLLHGFRETLRRHPALAPAVANELACNAAFDGALPDQVLAALGDAGFTGDALVDAFNVVIAALCGFATLELSSAPAGDAKAWEAACRAQIDAVDRQRHPHLGRHLARLRNRAFLLRWSSGKEAPLDSGFDAWVDVVLRGLQARARALRRAGGGA